MKASQLIEAKLSRATPEYLRSKEGRRIIAKCLRHIKAVEGKDKAQSLAAQIAVWSVI